jgi:sugar O-acyltransferase (sialic acid O-acetyltransferase NeuD family)
MKNITIYGAGGFGREVACLINRINEKEPTWNMIGFWDDGISIGENISHYGKVLGGINELNEVNEELNVIISIGSPLLVKNIVNNINNDKICFPNIIHPSCKIADSEAINIGIGNLISRDCFFSCDVSIGNFNIFNSLTSLGHDVKIGSYNSFMPAVRISGEVSIGDTNFFGINSVVLQQINISNNIRIGAGSIVINNPEEGNIYIGNPAKKFRF